MKRVRGGMSIAILVLAVIGCGSTSTQPEPSASSALESVKAEATSTPPMPTATAVHPIATPTVSYREVEIAYWTKVLPQLDKMQDSLKRFGVLIKEPKMGNTTWQVDLAKELAVWRLVYTEARSLEPSPRLRVMHDTYLTALQAYSEAAMEIAQGVDRRDMQGFTTAMLRMQEGNLLLREASSLIRQSR